VIRGIPSSVIRSDTKRKKGSISKNRRDEKKKEDEGLSKRLFSTLASEAITSSGLVRRGLVGRKPNWV